MRVVKHCTYVAFFLWRWLLKVLLEYFWYFFFLSYWAYEISNISFIRTTLLSKIFVLILQFWFLSLSQYTKYYCTLHILTYPKHILRSPTIKDIYRQTYKQSLYCACAVLVYSTAMVGVKYINKRHLVWLGNTIQGARYGSIKAENAFRSVVVCARRSKGNQTTNTFVSIITQQ